MHLTTKRGQPKALRHANGGGQFADGSLVTLAGDQAGLFNIHNAVGRKQALKLAHQRSVGTKVCKLLGIGNKYQIDAILRQAQCVGDKPNIQQFQTQRGSIHLIQRRAVSTHNHLASGAGECRQGSAGRRAKAHRACNINIR